MKKTQIELPPTLLDIYYTITFEASGATQKLFIRRLKLAAAEMRERLDEEDAEWQAQQDAKYGSGGYKRRLVAQRAA